LQEYDTNLQAKFHIFSTTFQTQLDSNITMHKNYNTSSSNRSTVAEVKQFK